jgi:hypothetical protein
MMALEWSDSKSPEGIAKSAICPFCLHTFLYPDACSVNLDFVEAQKIIIGVCGIKRPRLTFSNNTQQEDEVR